MVYYFNEKGTVSCNKCGYEEVDLVVIDQRRSDPSSHDDYGRLRCMDCGFHVYGAIVIEGGSIVYKVGMNKEEANKLTY